MPLPTLAYHTVRPARAEDPRPALAVGPERFAAHVAAFRRWGHRLTAFAGLAEPWGRRAALLTFDDGFASVHEHAFPLLAEHRLTATVFLVPGRIGGYNGFSGNRDASGERLLDACQVREMGAAGTEFGSHTVDHVDLPAVDDATLRRELARSRAPSADLVGRDGLLRLKRVILGRSVGPWRLRYRLSRFYEWEHAWKRRRKGRRRP